MPLDLSGFKREPNNWAGLYHVADQLEKRKARQDQLDLQKQSKRAAAGSFLQDYLNPKDMLSGTAYDPMIIQGLQAAQQQGAQLAAAGADAPTLMMALGPMVNKLSMYSTNAKTINKQVDDQIKLMRESGFTGYDYGALKDLALKKAFYKNSEHGQELVDPSEIDANANYIQKAIEDHPEQVTTAAGLDLFAKNSPMNKVLSDRQKFTGQGELDRSKVHLIGQNWLTPERDKTGRITELVPKHDIATENGQPLFHEFKDERGNTKREQVRLLSEDVFDDMMQRRPDIADYIKGVVKQHLGDYRNQTGNEISVNDPQAKKVARAIAYNELNRRKTSTIENAEIIDKPSQAQVNLNIQSTDKYLQNVEDKAAASKRGRTSVLTPTEEKNFLKRNVGQVFGDVFTGKEDLNVNPKSAINGNLFLPDGKSKAVNNYKVVDITSSMPGGGLNAGKGADHKFGSVYFHPENRSLIVEQKTGPQGNQATKFLEYPEENVGQFINQVAEANGIPKNAVRKLLDDIGYNNGKFTKSKAPSQPPANPAALDFNKRANSWRFAFGSPQKQ